MARGQLTAVIHREGELYVSWCPDFDIASQGPTVEEARRNLVEAVRLFLECADEAEVAERLQSEIYITPLEVSVG